MYNLFTVEGPVCVAADPLLYTPYPILLSLILTFKYTSWHCVHMIVKTIIYNARQYSKGPAVDQLRHASNSTHK